MNRAITQRELNDIAWVIDVLRNLEADVEDTSIGGKVVIWDESGQEKLGVVEENYVDDYKEWTFVASA